MMTTPHDAATVERLVGIARRYAASEQDNHRAVRLLLLAAQAEVGVELPYEDGEALVESARILPAASEPPTFRTLADIDDTPQGDLLFGMLEPDGPTLIYAGGGVGKGTTSAALIRDCEGAGIRPLVYDAELHPREWRRRTAGLGVDPEFVVYRDPTELPSHLLGRPLHDIVPHLGDVARAAGCGILFMDSILAGANLSEEGLKADARAPYQYTAALAELGIPSVSIGHTPKNSLEGDPYGSVSWINAMRLTWLGTRAEGDGHRVRWQPRKRNERGHIPAFILAFEYDMQGRLCGVTKEDDEQATRAWLTDAMTAGPRTVDELADELAELEDGPHTAAAARAKDRIRQALGRMRRAGLAHKTGGRGAPWALGAGSPGVSRKALRDRAA
jgi:hypothetical protein